MDGTFNARLHVAGRSATPNVSGSVGVPAGEINGLPFINGAASLAADARGVSIRDASVLVGTTQTYSRPKRGQRHRDARCARRVRTSPISTTSSIPAIRSTATAPSSSRRRRVMRRSPRPGNRRARVSLPELADRRYQSELVERAQRRYRGARRRRQRGDAPGEGFDRPCACVGVAIDAVAFTIRLGQRGEDDLDLSRSGCRRSECKPCRSRAVASGTASVHGRYPNMALKANAAVANGTLGPLTLDRADLSLHSAGRRVVIDRAEIATSTLSATAAGTLGLVRPSRSTCKCTRQPITSHNSSTTSRGTAYRLGSFESTLKIGGTYKSPTFLAGFDASNVVANGIPIAALFGEVRVARRALVLSDAGATFTHGEATLAGSIPLELAPLRLAAPMSRSRSISTWSTRSRNSRCRRSGTTMLTGTIDGHVGLSGTIARPEMSARRTDQRLVRERPRARADLADRGRLSSSITAPRRCSGVGAARKRHLRGLRRRRLLQRLLRRPPTLAFTANARGAGSICRRTATKERSTAVFH